MKLKLAVPKGSLQEATVEIFKKAGIKIRPSDRSYFPTCDDDELDIMLVRAQEIPKYVEDGVFDAGITGYDWLTESGAKVSEVCELIYAKSGFRPVRWVLAVPESSKIRSAKDLRGKRIATELVNFTRRYFASKKIKVEVEFSWGATEAKTPALVDAIVELTETGSSLRANKLKIIEELLTSTTRLVANRAAFKNPWKKEKLENLAMLLTGALTAEGLVGLKMNVREQDLPRIIGRLSALKNPTVSHLTTKGWVAIEVVIEECVVKKIIPTLKRLGAQGIIEYPLNKVIY